MDQENMAEAEQPQIERPETVQSVDLNSKFPLHTLEFDKGKVEFRDIQPENPRSPESTPLLMMTGWAMNQEVVGNTVKGLYEKGAHPVPVDFEGSTLSVKDESDLLAQLVTELKDEKVDILGQSLAAITILSMIENHPKLRKRIGKVVLVSPMGLGGKDNMLNLAKRQNAETKRNNAREKTEEDRQIEPKVAEAFKSFIKRNIIRAGKEIWHMARADKYDALELLKKEGIKTAIIQGDLDQLNSSGRVWRNVAERSGVKSRVGDPSLIRPEIDKDDLPIPAKDLTPEEANVAKEFIKKELEVSRQMRDEGTYPQFDSITMTAGGHEIHGPERIAEKILFAMDSLDVQFEGGDTLEARTKEKDRIAAEERELTRVRSELSQTESDSS